MHGSVSDWIAFSARFPDGDATVALASAQKRPWFVRVTDYPGLGSALAWDQPVVLDADESVALTFDGLVADGRLADAEVAGLLA